MSLHVRNTLTTPATERDYGKRLLAIEVRDRLLLVVSAMADTPMSFPRLLECVPAFNEVMKMCEWLRSEYVDPK